MDVTKSVVFDKVNKTFIIDDEDHTLGNLIQYQTLQNDNVEFAGCRMDNPLDRKLLFRLDAGTHDPVAIMDESLDILISLVNDMENDFKQTIMNK